MATLEELKNQTTKRNMQSSFEKAEHQGKEQPTVIKEEKITRKSMKKA